MLESVIESYLCMGDSFQFVKFLTILFFVKNYNVKRQAKRSNKFEQYRNLFVFSSGLSAASQDTAQEFVSIFRWFIRCNTKFPSPTPRPRSWSLSSGYSASLSRPPGSNRHQRLSMEGMCRGVTLT